MIVRHHRQIGQVPAIVPIVLTQAFKFHHAGAITRSIFEAQLERLRREELQPRGFVLVMRELTGGRARFLIETDSTGDLCATIECAPLRRRSKASAKPRAAAGHGASRPRRTSPAR